MFTKVANICLPTGVSLLAQNSEYSYLIFVISFTQATLANSKFHTQKLTKNTPNYSKISLKGKIYADFVFNLENFTPDKIFLHAHGARNNYQVCSLVGKKLSDIFFCPDPIFSPGTCDAFW